MSSAMIKMILELESSGLCEQEEIINNEERN